MTSTDWIAIAGGAAAIALVNWWFFIASESARAAVTAAGQQVVNIVVRGGYSPATIHVKSGETVKLVFERLETSGCSEEIVLPDFGIRRYLPANEKTEIEVKPEKAGTYEFTCGMSMLRGRIVAE